MRDGRSFDRLLGWLLDKRADEAVAETREGGDSNERAQSTKLPQMEEKYVPYSRFL